jgi:predicted O-methyltransferase YrrM
MKRADRLTVTMTIPWDGKDYRGSYLLHLIEKNNFKTIAEVGVKFGRTTFFLLDNVHDLVIHAVDLDISMFYNEEIKSKYKDRLIPIKGYSYNVADQLPNNSMDLIFIDADHSYESVKKDILAYTPKLKDNGILSGHDIDYPGVNKAVRELIKDFDVGPNNVWIKHKGNI